MKTTYWTNLILGTICVVGLVYLACSTGPITVGLLNKGDKLGTTETGQSNSGVVTAPKQTNEGDKKSNSGISEGGDVKMYPEWEFLKVIGILLAIMVVLTEVIGNIPLANGLSKKLLSVVFAILAVCAYKIFSSHDWLYLFLMGAISWYIGNSLWRDLVNGSMWKGWFKKETTT